jgi:hypothetical protein
MCVARIPGHSPEGAFTDGKIRAASASERTCRLAHRMSPDGSLALPARTPRRVRPPKARLCQEKLPHTSGLKSQVRAGRGKGRRLCPGRYRGTLRFAPATRRYE